MKPTLTADEEKHLKVIVEHFEDEDRTTRQRQILQWRRLKLFWDGFSHHYYSEVAHDWRIYNPDSGENNDQEHYDKPVNIFRAYLESIIAALSATIPSIKCYPDDAENQLDLMTAKASDKIAELIYRHNDVILIWLHALYIFCTEGMVACYTYSKSDEKFGTYKENKFEKVNEITKEKKCPECAFGFDSASVGNSPTAVCPNCETEVIPVETEVEIEVTKLVGTTQNPKTRQCMEVYGGTYVQIPNYAKKQEDCPYLIFKFETHYSNARNQYNHIRDKIHEERTSSGEEYERYARANVQYQGEQAENNVTIKNVWLRPSAFEVLVEEKDSKHFKGKFPKGLKAVFVNDIFAEVVIEELDDHWTLTHNPLSDFIHHDPIGLSLVSTQEITNDLISLVLQTIEHGIPQTFADTRVVSFAGYKTLEVAPGAIYPATAPSGRTLSDGFHEVKTATLSQEVLPFAQQIQNLAQLVSGALPSLFGGQIEGSKTASEYNMSRTQALQRQQNTYRIFSTWWKQIFGKVIPSYIKNMKEDEKFVAKDESGNFINVFIRRSETEGKIGNIELDPSENLPMTWMQRKDAIMNLIQLNNPQLLQMLFAPENISQIKEAIGLTSIFIPGEDDKAKQYDEIKQLLDSKPIEVAPTEEFMLAVMQAQEQGLEPPPPEETPSVEVDPIFDNHQIEFTIIRNWMVSPAGREAKIKNPDGYRNCLLHAKGHHLAMIEQQPQAPVEGESNVPVEPATESAPAV